MLILISYDVADDRRRTRLAHALKDFGVRVQYSVFECHLDPSQLDLAHHRLSNLIDAAKDSVQIYRLCRDCAAKTDILGLGTLTDDPNLYVL